MLPLCSVLIAFATALVVVTWVHPRLVQIALMKGIVDNPDARKLQRRPVPVLGGLAVFLGIVAGVGVMSPFVDNNGLALLIAAMTVMLYTGTMDDILNLSPTLRFVIEILVVGLLIGLGRFCIDDFHGLWGVGQISWWIAVPLTIFATVGIINAINLIDGVNGLSSGYCILACSLFGILFYWVGNTRMALLAVAAVGSLIPFFLHNVFGKTSKMFIGDGGTLVMGLIMSLFVVSVLRHNSLCALYAPASFGLIPFMLAILAVPVFDTLRVMSARMLRGRSPFQPDKTHLHHLWIELGCSHVATTLLILMMNLSVVLLWWVVYRLGGAIDLQLYVVIAWGLIITVGVYQFMQWNIRHDTRLLHLIRRVGYHTHLSRTRVFIWMQKHIDKI